MTETEQWIVQARELLEALRRGRSEAHADRVKSHMSLINVAQIQADLGCGDDCAACSWGTLGGQPLGCEPCRLLVLQRNIEELQVRGTRRASVRAGAVTLLQLLNSLPERNPSR